TIRNIAKNKNLKPQEVLQMYLFERILERLSLSKYKDNFVLKGGLLIASMIGVESRSTLDMDATVRGIPMEEEIIRDAILELIQVDVGDGIEFILQKMEPIREEDSYNNFRVHLKASYGKINAPMKIDITTGDIITPSAIDYSFKLLFEDKVINVMAYNLETILAEKYETIIRRNIGTTRARDFYDLYILFKSRILEIQKNNFIRAVENTAKKRGSTGLLSEWQEICEEIREEPALEKIWINYQKDNHYAIDISFEDVTRNLLEVAQYLNISEK
ncbi:MAG: nucleotidyl transferase AbiEii/AbiGii toxin family protein, partial [Peptostreptococcaceae bacterium]|nr:nucleotidyl transferase AbiEii/AbiGii toxin family protein [Peptostreptococcaceae bacterium]